MKELFWKSRAKHGRDKIFSTPEILWEAALEYFQWVEDNPLEKAIVYQGMALGSENLMRAMTVKGLCIFLGVNSKYFNDFNASLDLTQKKDKDFSEVSILIREIIDTQKFEGASAGLLNSSIIARDLGLADKQESIRIEMSHEDWLNSLE
jgi:hypothetical protein|tara:strand:- start:34 stop:483 length:450 start_codon:yes stop_codon:yes gene_type:complete